MKKHLLVAVVATVIGCGAAAAQTAIPPAPQDFATASVQSDAYEIMAAHLVETGSQNAEVKSFAEAMIRDHTRLSDETRRAATASGLQPPPLALSSDQAALLSGLQGVRGADLDKAYARQQVLAHTQAATVTQSFAEGGADANLKSSAQAALPTIKDHLGMAKQLQAKLGSK